MKRLFALWGFTYLFVQIAVFYVCKELAFVVTIIAVLLGVASLAVSKDKYFKQTVCTACIVSIVASMVFYFYSVAYFEPASNEYNNQEVTVYAELSEEPHKSYGMYYYELKAEKMNCNQTDVKLLLKSAYQLDMEVFDYISFKAKLEKCDNKGYLARGYLYKANVGYDFDYNVTTDEEKPFYGYIIDVRNSMKHAIDVLMPTEIANLSKAISIGDRFAVDTELKEDFRKTGVSHFIVVSGLHLVILSEFVRRILSLISRRNRFVECLGTILIILAFVALTGFGSSVIRAGIMLIIYLTGKMFFVKADSLNSLGFAVLCLCVPNPFAVGDIGMLLSIFATFGIVVFSKRIEEFFCSKLSFKNKYINKVYTYIINTVSVTSSAYLMILPITLLAFNSFSIMVYLATLIISPFVSLFIVCILSASVLYYAGFLSVFSNLFAFIACIIGEFIIFVVELLSEFKFALVYVDSGYCAIIVASIAILIGIAVIFEKYKHLLPYAVIISVIVFVTGLCVSMYPKTDKIHILNAEKGSTVVLESSKGVAVLSCGGTASKTADVLKSLSVKSMDISYLTIPDNKNTSSRYAKDILKEFDCFGVLLYDTDKTDEAVYRYAQNVEDLMTFSENETVYTKLWDNGFVNVINIDGVTWQFANYMDYRVLIIPEKADCIDIPDEYKTAEIIISASCPENCHLLNCNTFVYTGTQEDFHKYYGNFAEISQEIALTANNDVTIKLS